MVKSNIVVFSVVILGLISVRAISQDASVQRIPPGSKVYIQEMPDNFTSFLKAAFQKKKVPLVVVENEKDAEFLVTGAAESEKASTAKKVLALSWHSNESASIKIVDAKTEAVVFAYSAMKYNSAHGRQSTAEACAKHVKDKIEDGK